MLNYYFDLDNTICESKQKISKEMKETLSELPNCTVISGAFHTQIKKQLDGLKCIILSQSGNCTPAWKVTLQKQQIWEVRNHIRQFGKPFDLKKFQNRGSQISYSFVGHHAPIEKKKSFDPSTNLRKHYLLLYPFKSKTMTVRIGGTTCLDYTLKDGTKGQNLKLWMREKGLKKKDCIYFGDALFKGGNDETVKGIMKTVSIKNPNELLLKLKKYV